MPGDFPSRARQETGFERRALSALLGLLVIWTVAVTRSRLDEFLLEIESSQEDDTPPYQ